LQSGFSGNRSSRVHVSIKGAPIRHRKMAA
jgi:hypothetical protein